MDAPQSINVSYYIQLLNMILKDYRKRLDIMARRNKVINDFIETFTKGDTIRGISDNAFDTTLVNSRRALAEMKQLLEEDRGVIRSIRGEEKEEEMTLGKAIEDLDFAIELLNRKVPRHYIAWHGVTSQSMDLEVEQNEQSEVKKRLKKEKFNLNNFKHFCQDARKLLHHVEKNMGDIEHRLGLEEAFLNKPNRDTLSIFVAQWREEVKKELELQAQIKIFMKKQRAVFKIFSHVASTPLPISYKFALDISKKAFPGIFITGMVGTINPPAAAGAVIAIMVTATTLAIFDLKSLFDEIEKTAEISSEKLIGSVSGIERKHWWDIRFG